MTNNFKNHRAMVSRLSGVNLCVIGHQIPLLLSGTRRHKSNLFTWLHFAINSNNNLFSPRYVIIFRRVSWRHNMRHDNSEIVYAFYQLALHQVRSFTFVLLPPHRLEASKFLLVLSLIKWGSGASVASMYMLILLSTSTIVCQKKNLFLWHRPWWGQQIFQLPEKL